MAVYTVQFTPSCTPAAFGDLMRVCSRSARDYDLIRVGFNTVLQHYKLHICRLEHLTRILSGVVLTMGNDANNSDTDDQHRAYTTGLHFAIESRSVQAQSVFRSLANGVLFRMNGPDAVLASRAIVFKHPLQQVPDFIAVWQPGREPTYPVAMILLSITTTQPLRPRSHVARAATSCVMCMKYSSQLGLTVLPPRYCLFPLPSAA